MELHAVIIHKPITLEHAQKLKSKWIHDDKFIRETNDSYRFRNIPKTKFKSFKTKVINDKVSLIYGELK